MSEGVVVVYGREEAGRAWQECGRGHCDCRGWEKDAIVRVGMVKRSEGREFS